MRILITGTTSGIGEYLAEKLNNDFSIIGTGRSNNTIENIDFLKGNLREENFLKEINDFLKKEKIDYLILNAGVGYFDKFKNISEEENKSIIETNLLSPILLTSLLLKSNSINKGIIFIGSIAGKKSMKFGASYAASKFGLRGFAMQLKNELSNLNIHIINPRIVKTNFHTNSIIDITGNKNYKETSLESILEVIQNIIKNKENKFEIDL